jgi:acetolactate synthase-1/2/3 large subunit
LKGSNNAELIAGMLRDFGVRWVFGVPSGPVLPLIEALRVMGMEYVLTASETSAGFMASVVGELTGTPGVCVATLGPGATNLATGVGAAWLDRAPVLAITCNVGTAWLDRRVQMRIDHHALMAPLTKASRPLRSESVAETMSAALELACLEPPGPVHLDLPEDVATADVTGASGAQGYARRWRLAGARCWSRASVSRAAAHGSPCSGSSSPSRYRSSRPCTPRAACPRATPAGRACWAERGARTSRLSSTVPT